MPSIRGYKKGINDKELKKAIDRYTSHIATIAAKAGREAMRELRRSAVKKWYNGSTASGHMNNATIVESDSPKQKKGKIEITIRSYVDIAKFEASKKNASENNKFSSPYENVVKWRERHEIGNRGSDGRRGGTGYWTYYDREPSNKNPLREVMNMKYSIGEYLFKLPWDDGTIGLPPNARDTGTGWVNPKPIVRDPSLEEYVKKYLKDKWEETVSEKFAEFNK